MCNFPHHRYSLKYGERLPPRHMPGSEGTIAGMGGSMDGCRAAGSAHRTHTPPGFPGTGDIVPTAGTGSLSIGEADQVQPRYRATWPFPVWLAPARGPVYPHIPMMPTQLRAL